MKKLVYVAGSGHSGTTMLGLILAQHSKLVGLGEILQALQVTSEHSAFDEIRKRETPCSCGNTLDHCVFWAKVDAALKENKKGEYFERLQVVLQTIEELYGKDRRGVDTSKSLVPIGKMLQNGMEVKVIHLIRDVRAYSISYVDRSRVRRSRGLPVSRKKKGWLSEALMKHSAYYFLDWYSQNRKIQTFLRANAVPTFQVGYEELCLYPSLMIEKICGFLEIPVEPGMLSLEGSSQSHIIRGNRMRYRSEKKQIRYDNRWFYRPDWVLPSILFPHVMRFNRREVYKNTAGVLWEEKG